MKIATDPFGTEYIEYEPGEHPDACPVCHQPLADHHGGLPCIESAPSRATGWWSLPVAGAMWRADGSDLTA